MGLLGPTQPSGDVPDRTGRSFFFAGLFFYSGRKSLPPPLSFTKLTYLKLKHIYTFRSRSNRIRNRAARLSHRIRHTCPTSTRSHPVHDMLE